jgi:uncharacterized protein DUF1638
MKTALIVCGALSAEVLALKQKHGWNAQVFALPALLHNSPDQIPPSVLHRIRKVRKDFDQIVVVYGDCGTGGQLDALLEREAVKRVRGPHCYEMYGHAVFEELMEQEPGTFFLTDFLVTHFDRLVLEELGLDRFPQLREDYFAHYTRVVYLAQRPDPTLFAKAQQAAERLALPLEIRHVGYGALESRLLELINTDTGVSESSVGETLQLT